MLFTLDSIVLLSVLLTFVELPKLTENKKNSTKNITNLIFREYICSHYGGARPMFSTESIAYSFILD